MPTAEKNGGAAFAERQKWGKKKWGSLGNIKVSSWPTAARGMMT